MCLILFAINPDSTHELVIATNRDEYYARPTRMAGFWPEEPHLLAGKDLEMGGTWLGITRSGRFAAVTNFRETPLSPPPPLSRGGLTLNFLLGDLSPRDYLTEIQGRSQAYRGFNLLLGAKGDYFYFSNRSENIVNLAPGYYGLSNQLLDCDWPKVRLGQQKLRRAQEAGFDSTSLFELLADKGGDEAFSASFIESTEYGTCASTVLNVSPEGQVNFEEQNFLPMGRKGARNQFSFVMARS